MCINALLKRYQHKIEQFIKKLEFHNFKVVRQNILENINKMPVIVLATPELKSATLSNELSFDSLLSNEIYQISKKRVRSEEHTSELQSH